MNTFENLNDAVLALKDAMIADYATWYDRTNERDDTNKEWRENYAKEQIAQYADTFKIEEGRNYIKLVANGSVKGFVVKKATKGFVVGDMLMAASYKAPATNFSRGNALLGEFDRVRWTGIL